MGQSRYTPAFVEEEARDKLPGFKGEVVLKRRRLSGEEELSNDNGTERWEMGKCPLVQVEGEIGSLDGRTLETRM